MMNRLLAALALACALLTPALAQVDSAGVRSVAGKRGVVTLGAGDVGAMACPGTCVEREAWLTALESAKAGARLFVRTNYGSALPAIVQLKADGTGDALTAWTMAQLGLNLTQMTAVFQAAGASVNVNGVATTAVLPTLAQLGAAAADMSNVSSSAVPTFAALSLTADLFMGGNLHVSGQNTFLYHNDYSFLYFGVPNAPVGARVWQLYMNPAGDIGLSASNDSLTAFSNAWFCNRSGLTVLGCSFTVPAVFNADVRVKVGGFATTAVSWLDAGLPVTPQMFGALCNSNGTPGNGHDDTAAIQSAVNYAQALGMRLKIPGRPMVGGTPQMCRTTSVILIYPGLKLFMEGDGAQPYINTRALTNTPGPGSWLYFDHAGVGINAFPDGLGGGSCGTATGLTSCAATSGTALRDFGTYRNQPAYVSSGTWTPSNNDYDIILSQDDNSARDLLLLNPTRGMLLDGRFTLEDIRLNPFLVGIQMDSSQDVPRLENIHMWPFGTINGPVGTYTRANLEALRMARADNPHVSGFFAIGAKVCMHFFQNGYGFTNHFRGVNIDCDQVGNTGILVDASGTTGQIANLTIQGADPDSNTGSSLTTSYSGINISGSNNHWGISNVAVTKVGGAAVYASGAGNWLDLSGFVNMDTWAWGGAHGNSGTAAIDAEPGATITLPARPLFNPGATSSVQYGGAGNVYKPSDSKVN